ncbi:TPA: transporter substrate-binding domain-containing protein [Stenotrophomonas maltophilia]|nr:transporter substrate-binding domain-containing protein [Stenotrophomonas maltophilia]HDS1024825.1 transporter substrate-binding domain-containing protein [Stenotrophomonas maltophilia]HDS1028869.1 transporter substrate-binding domain-containing protein [Stenotrophomonas maltophilia]HDS1032991.1 transporter substrate-binding domain-containing protein [Stenotrophomonas maltophilia]
MRSGAVCRWSLLMVVLCLPVLAWAAPGALPLSAQQRAYLAANPVIVVGQYDSGWPPFESMRQGQLVGLGPDYLSLLARQLGLKVETRRYPDWTAVLDAACRGEIDVVMNVALNAERTRCMVYTDAYGESPLAMVGRPDDLRASEAPDLEGLRVVIEQDFITGSQVRARFPRARQIVADNTSAALRMVNDDKADIFIGNAYVATELIARDKLPHVSLLRPSDLAPERLHFGIPNGKQPLAEALDLALAATSQAQRDALEQRWLPVPQWSASAQLALSQAEKRVLQQTLKIGFAPNAAPLSFADAQGQPSGLASEYLRRLMQAGAHLQVEPSHDWFEVREKARSGELQAVMGMPADSRYMGPDWVFSQPFISVPNVIVSSSGSPAVLGIADLQGKRVLLSDPERLRGYVLQEAPRAKIIAARSAEQALQRLQAGEADAYIGNLALVDHLLRERYPGRLLIAAPAGFSDQLALAVNRRHAALATTFDRLMLQMSARERESLRNDWLAVEYSPGMDWGRVLRWTLPLLLVLLTAAVVHALSHWRLRREVSDRRRVEQRLAEVTDNLPATVYQARREADGTLSFPFIAGDVQALFGVSRDQATADAGLLLSRIEEDDRAVVLRAVEVAARNFAPLAFEFRVSTEGVTRWVRSQAHPYSTEAGAVTWSGYWVDVSEARAQADALATAKLEAEQAADAKSRFLATMSHEIRTPMSGVLGMLEVLTHSPLDAEQKRIIAVIEDSAQMLRQILDDILDYSRMEAGALRLEPVPLPLRPLLESVCRLLAPQASARGLELRVDIDPRLASAHEVDGVRLRQIVFNLLSNAIKFTQEGSVRLQLEVMGETTAEGSQPLRLSVSDTGIGIAPQQIPTLFEPFTQAGAYIQRDHGGTGLGLSICRRLVHKMGGELILESTLGEGTRVEVLLSLVEAGSEDVAALLAEQQQVSLLPPPLRQARVLVVEDHPTNQAMMAWRLQQLGVPHVLVEDGQQALDRLAQEPFDLVITDCRMPVMDGFAFARLLREREGRTGQPRLPVLALTASVLDDDTRRCREAGMDDVLAKPLSLATLRQALLRWLPQGGHSVLEAADASPAEARTAEGAAAAVAEQEGLPDLAALQQRFGSRDVATQLRDSLLAASHDDLRILQQGLRDGDRALLAQHLHRQAGALGAVGARGLADRANALVERLQQNEGTATESALADTAAFVDHLQQQLQRLAY